MQPDIEQRQSSRFSRHFIVTDYDDVGFSEPFDGFDVNLTGLSFWVDEVDLFYPKQLLSLRVKNLDNEEVYRLEGVEVIHIRAAEGRYICGCHITHVTSSQLLAHHRLVIIDEEDALVSLAVSEVSEFDFVEDGSLLSTDQSDYQEAGMALNLAVSQLDTGRLLGEKLLKQMKDSLEKVQETALKAELNGQFREFTLAYRKMSETTMALGMLAKLLAHTPNEEEDKQAWKTMVADFEKRFLTEEQQIAYDFMHQGLSAQEALQIAGEYLDEE
ncbi:PilZ domain-containing protein [Thiomicrorhabdus sp. ZW0627]|uniref:PilZ domain-containing protein n=1 Tax=Thiomicrorhabdus sp. ZW0627 TaxID=3039774 RepID=UPI0024368036|nr:PilZ domain-containing protein [Thiomicrorhabdus sp. ZW0627]MDG6773272.1 PilZ domain-containing protein [Thiomicrorhabdus sp. ZW0627]